MPKQNTKTQNSDRNDSEAGTQLRVPPSQRAVRETDEAAIKLAEYDPAADNRVHKEQTSKAVILRTGHTLSPPPACPKVSSRGYSAVSALSIPVQSALTAGWKEMGNRFIKNITVVDNWLCVLLLLSSPSQVSLLLDFISVQREIHLRTRHR